jgi:hypothetical protein
MAHRIIRSTWPTTPARSKRGPPRPRSRLAHRGGILALCCLAVSSCSNQFDWVSPSSCESAQRFPPPAPPSAVSPPVDQWLVRASTRIPGGFAGIDQDGRKTAVLLVHPELGDSAMATIRRLGTSVVPVNPDLMEIKPARWTFDELVTWYQHVVPLVGGSAQASVSIDMHCNAIVIQVPSPENQRRIVERLASMNWPCKLVGVLVVAPVPTNGHGGPPPGSVSCH